MITDDILAALGGRAGATRHVIDLYRVNRPGATPGDLLAALLTDRFFWRPALAVAEARLAAPASTYVYEFAWRSPAIGAAHALEIPFVFDTLATARTDLPLWPDAPQEIADNMHAAWVNFAAAGDPGWPRFDARRAVQVFDSGGGVTLDPRRDERLAWAT